MLFKKIACFLLSVVMAAQPLVVNAADLGTAFTNLVGSGGGAVSVQGAGRFNSAARSGFSGGGVEVRVPRGGSAPQLFSASSPRITAGCNGISAHFGGFSFISGQEFVDLIKGIASGAALGFVSSLVMKTLCPACEAVVQELKSAAQAAARLAKDSCAIGQNWGKQFSDGLSNQTDLPDSCARTAPASGETSDYMSAISSICGTLRKATATLNDLNPAVKGTGRVAEEAKAGMQCITGQGNITWSRLMAFDTAGSLQGIANESNARKILLINLLGAEMTYAGDDVPVGCENGDSSWWEPSGAEDKKDNTHYCSPTMDMKSFVDVFMCGARSSRQVGTMSAAGVKYCDDLDRSAGGDIQMWNCKGDKAGTSENFTTCPFLKREPVGNVFQGQGFLVRVNSLLKSAVERVRTGVGYEDAEGRQIIALINAAPYPLYQAINAAAIYPSAATELLDGMSVMVAETFVHVLIDEMMRLEGRSSSKLCMPRQQAMQVLDFVTSMRAMNKENLAKIATNFTVQQQLSEQIRTLNIAIQREVMSEELLQSGKLGQSLNRALTPANVGTAMPGNADPVTP